MTAKTNILNAAAALARTDGVTALGIERVVQKAGASKGAFFYHFKSKEEMIRALLDHVSAQCMHEVNRKVGNGARFTDALIDMVTRELRENGELIAVLVASVSLDPSLRPQLTSHVQEVRNRMITEDSLSAEQADLLRLAIDGAMIGTVLYDIEDQEVRSRQIEALLRSLAAH